MCWADQQLSNLTRLLVVIVLLTAAPAVAQREATWESAFADVDWAAQTQFQANGSLRLVGTVELGSEDEGWRLDADEVLLDSATSRIMATGSVVFVASEVRIAAERVELNMSDHTAIFYDAHGAVVNRWRGNDR